MSFIQLYFCFSLNFFFFQRIIMKSYSLFGKEPISLSIIFRKPNILPLHFQLLTFNINVNDFIFLFFFFLSFLQMHFGWIEKNKKKKKISSDSFPIVMAMALLPIKHIYICLWIRFVSGELCVQQYVRYETSKLVSHSRCGFSNFCVPTFRHLFDCRLMIKGVRL